VANRKTKTWPKAKKKTKMTETKTVARRGRPSNFPGIKTSPRLYKLPQETIDMIEAEAARKEEAVGVAVDRLIRSGFKNFNKGK
jgi:hypothetical protein